MKKILVTGSNGLIGSEVTKFYLNLGYNVIGIDNNMREYFFGISNTIHNFINDEKYQDFNVDIRDYNSLSKIFLDYTSDIDLIIHTAAQPSHDWAAKEPMTDFSVNATGTLNLLECFRNFCPNATFIFTSTNKVYGDNPNKLNLFEEEFRWELTEDDRFYKGINENMSIDNTKHSLFGVSKSAADLLVQEYGKYFNLKTGIFRGGCLTGPQHAGAELHGFLSYLIKCFIYKKPYTVFGYKGKQVRDNIHSYDLVTAFHEFYKNPKNGEVYNIGGSRHSNISMLESINLISETLNSKLDYSISEKNRIGDHIWYISDVSKFQSDYPNWNYKYNIQDIINEMIENELKNIK